MSESKNAWRQSGSHRQQASRSGSGASTPVGQSRSRPESVNFSAAAAKPPPQPAAPPTTNAWADRAAKQKQAAQVSRKPTPVASPVPASNAAVAAPAPGAAKHVPVNGFNSAEVKGVFQKGFAASTPGNLAATALHRPTNENSKNNAQPTGSIDCPMANGQDFFVELARQIAQIESARGG